MTSEFVVERKMRPSVFYNVGRCCYNPHLSPNDYLIRINNDPFNFSLYEGFDDSIDFIRGVCEELTQGFVYFFGELDHNNENTHLLAMEFKTPKHVDRNTLFSIMKKFLPNRKILFKEDNHNMYNNMYIEGWYNIQDFFSLLYDNSNKETRSKHVYDKYVDFFFVMPLEHFSSIPVLSVAKKFSNAVLPSKSRCSDVGYDLTIIKEEKKIGSTTVLYDTGIIIEPPLGYYCEVVPRSSLFKSGYMLTNSCGIIDPNYRDSIKVPLTKFDSSQPDLVLPFKGFQLILRLHEHAVVKEVSVEDLSSTSRGTGGFGSTGGFN